MKYINTPIFIYAFCVVFFPPFYLVALVDIVQLIFKLAISAIILLLYLLNKKMHNNLVTISMCLYGTYIVSAVINHGDVAYTINQFGVACISIMMMSLVMERNPKILVESMCKYWTVNCIINTIMALTLRNSLNYIFWLGNDNVSVQYYLLSCMLSFLCCYMYGRRYVFGVSLCNMIMFVIIRQIGTGLVLIIFMLSCWFIVKVLNINPQKLKMAYFFSGIVIMYLSYFALAFNNKITNLVNYISFGKYKALEIRINLQRFFVGEVLEHPLLGVGRYMDLGRKGISFEDWILSGKTHNYGLRIALEGGITALFFLIMLFCAIAKKYDKNNLDIICCGICFFYFLNCLRGLAETTDYVSFLFYPFLFYAYLMEDIYINNSSRKIKIVFWGNRGSI